MQSNNQMFTWERKDASGDRIASDSTEIVSALQEFVPAAIDEYGGDANRVAVVGFSQGGSLAYRLSPMPASWTLIAFKSWPSIGRTIASSALCLSAHSSANRNTGGHRGYGPLAPPLSPKQ